MGKKEAGEKGGKKNTRAQKKARLVNLYRALARKWPNSVVVRMKLEELQR